MRNRCVPACRYPRTADSRPYERIGTFVRCRGDQSSLQSPYQSPWVTDNVRCFGQSQFLLINRNIRDSQSQPLYRAIDTSHRLSFVIDFPIAFSVGANTLDSAFFFELFYSLCYRFSADSHFLRKLRHCVAGIFRKKR